MRTALLTLLVAGDQEGSTSYNCRVAGWVRVVGLKRACRLCVPAFSSPLLACDVYLNHNGCSKAPHVNRGLKKLVGVYMHSPAVPIHWAGTWGGSRMCVAIWGVARGARFESHRAHGEHAGFGAWVRQAGGHIACGKHLWGAPLRHLQCVPCRDEAQGVWGGECEVHSAIIFNVSKLRGWRAKGVGGC